VGCCEYVWKCCSGVFRCGGVTSLGVLGHRRRSSRPRGVQLAVG